MISSESAIKLRPVAYLTAAIFAISPLLDLTISAWPFSLGDAAWRNTFLTVLVPTCQSLLLALFITLLVTIAAGDRIASLVTASLCGVLAALLLAALPLGALDWLQLRPQVRPNLAKRFDAVAIMMMARMAAESVAFALMAIAAVRTAKRAERRGSPNGELVVGVPKPPAGRVLASAPATE